MVDLVVFFMVTGLQNAKTLCTTLLENRQSLCGDIHHSYVPDHHSDVPDGSLGHLLRWVTLAYYSRSQVKHTVFRGVKYAPVYIYSVAVYVLHTATPCADSCRLQVAFPDPFHHPPPVWNDYLFHLNETAARAGFSA